MLLTSLINTLSLYALDIIVGLSFSVAEDPAIAIVAYSTYHKIDRTQNLRGEIYILPAIYDV